MSHQRPQPPRLATSLLRVCCTRERLEEIEGDLYELFTRRVARLGSKRARQHYALDVGGVCIRQLWARVVIALARSRRVRRIVSVIVVLVATAVVLIANEQPWAVMTGYALLFGMGLVELLVYARAAYSLVDALTATARERTRRRDS
jgi:hypothetical protein